MKQTQRKHQLVKLNNAKEGNEFIEYLEQNGFINFHNICFDNLRIKVIGVGEQKFGAVSVTCLAALASSKIYPISVEEFKSWFELNNHANNL